MKPVRVAAAAALVFALPGAAFAAGAAVTPANQDAHYESLFTSAAQDCLDLDKLTGEERDEGCTKALEEVQDRRASAVNPTVGEKTDYDFFESLLSIAQASAYYQIDGKPSARVCRSAERSWTLHSALLAVPKASLSPKIYKEIHDIPASVGPVLTHCRQMFGTPADGAALPEG